MDSCTDNFQGCVVSHFVLTEFVPNLKHVQVERGMVGEDGCRS